MEAKGIGRWGVGSDHGSSHVSIVANYAPPGRVVSKRRDDGTHRPILPHGYLPAYSLLRYRFRCTTGIVAVS